MISLTGVASIDYGVILPSFDLSSRRLMAQIHDLLDRDDLSALCLLSTAYYEDAE